MLSHRSRCDPSQLSFVNDPVLCKRSASYSNRDCGTVVSATVYTGTAFPLFVCLLTARGATLADVAFPLCATVAVGW